MARRKVFTDERMVNMTFILNKRIDGEDYVVEKADNTGSLYVTLMDDLIKSATKEHSIRVEREPNEGIDLIVTLNNYDNDYEVIKWVVFVA